MFLSCHHAAEPDYSLHERRFCVNFGLIRGSHGSHDLSHLAPAYRHQVQSCGIKLHSRIPGILQLFFPSLTNVLLFLSLLLLLLLLLILIPIITIITVIVGIIMIMDVFLVQHGALDMTASGVTAFMSRAGLKAAYIGSCPHPLTVI